MNCRQTFARFVRVNTFLYKETTFEQNLDNADFDFRHLTDLLHMHRESTQRVLRRNKRLVFATKRETHFWKLLERTPNSVTDTEYRFTD